MSIINHFTVVQPMGGLAMHLHLPSNHCMGGGRRMGCQKCCRGNLVYFVAREGRWALGGEQEGDSSHCGSPAVSALYKDTLVSWSKGVYRYQG